ncbi:MAG: 2-oxoacid:ferredoxin oxidoreductase subunit beta [Nitrospirae bacterium]|nr:2-oxoacid:ferredoxin oxidoreductase subunit beta [Nitrospirota bacterium]
MSTPAEEVKAIAKKKKKVPFDYSPYIRGGKLPHIWCPGCGHGIVLKSLLRAVHASGLNQDDVAMVSGIGCSSRTPGYVDFNTLHTLHGRALTFATGLKLANPRLKVLVITGDGDALAIGGNHFIHACRRNLDLTILVYNNNIYGMTSGQSSPTTPQGKISTTGRHGSVDPVFDTCKLAQAAGATFVARGTAYHFQELEKIIFDAFMHKGTSVVDILDACPTYYGRFNKYASATDMMEQIEKDGTVSVKQAEKLSPEELQDKLLRGILHKAERPEYLEEYNKLVTSLQTKK